LYLQKSLKQHQCFSCLCRLWSSDSSFCIFQSQNDFKFMDLHL
jgi:hypothetical protein